MGEKKKCKDFLRCTEVNCPAYDSNHVPCWMMDGTRCQNAVQETSLSKVELCLECSVFKNSVDLDAMAAFCSLIARQASETRKTLEARDRELESVSMEMAIGLSEVFEALKRISTGDPSVRIEEDAGLELIVKLKQMVNHTAENMGDIVDMTHEFAMGLAEYFDVLHRVSLGDLEARVQGESSVELLESLKSMTNQMIASVKAEIDQRQKATRELQVSEERFRTVAEKAPIGITIMNPDRTFQFINQTFTEIFGYTLTDIPDKCVWFSKAYPDRELREKNIASWETYGRDKAGIGEVRPSLSVVRCKDGSDKTISFRTVVLENGNHYVTYEDITQQASAQKAIRESEEKYRSLVDNIQDGVVLLEKEQFLFVNDAFARMVGHTASEMVGMAFGGFVAPEDSAMVADRYRKRQQGEEVARSYEIQLLHKDRKTRINVNLNMGVIDYQNRVVTIGTVKDITERKVAERERQKLAERLQRSKKMEAIGTLAGGVAHDLNNILSGIVSYPELLLMDLADDSPLKRPLSTIQKSGERAAAIVQDLLTLARRGVATMEVIDLNQIVADYLKSPECAKMRSFHPRVTVESRLDPELFTILGSPVHLSKTVMNLVSNAAEAMPDGGMVTISTENRYVDKPFKSYDDVREGEYVVLTLADNGVGISARDMEQIFEPFYTKKVMGRSGTGLGMAVVWGTIRDHKGYIDVKSVEGQGSTFTLYFPMTREQMKNSTQSPSVNDYMGNGESILVVDDVEEQRTIAAAMLIRLGYRVAAVSSGEAAVNYMKSNVADIMILDMIMDPGIDGLETYRRVAAFKPGQKAVVASGFSETERVKALGRLGVEAYVKKPYSLEKIGMAVRKVLGG